MRVKYLLLTKLTQSTFNTNLVLFVFAFYSITFIIMDLNKPTIKVGILTSKIYSDVLIIVLHT